jgi:hypothetical protein
MKYYVLCAAILFGMSTQAQDDRLTKLTQRRAELQRSIAYYQKELREVELEIDQLNHKPSNTIVANDKGQKITTTVGDQGAIMRVEPTLSSPEIMQIPANATIYVHRVHQGLYFKVTYFGKEGWVNYTQIESLPEIDALVNEPKTNSTTTVLKVDENDPKYKRLLGIYGKENALKMMNGVLWSGMSQGQARESVGKPLSQTRENTSKGLKEDWEYADKKLVFLNGNLVSW